MYWNKYGEWWSLRHTKTDRAAAYIRYQQGYICYLTNSIKASADAIFPTLDEAKAWCEAMCALGGK